MFELDAANLDSVVRVIQSSLTPIFLLTAVASLLGVFTTRLARISDQVHELSDKATLGRLAGQGEDDLIKRRLAFLQRRSHILDVAVVLGAFAGASTCATALSLFLSLLRAKATVSIVFVLFGTALLCTIGALGAFLTEVLMASRGIRADVARQAKELKS